MFYRTCAAHSARWTRHSGTCALINDSISTDASKGSDGWLRSKIECRSFGLEGESVQSRRWRRRDSTRTLSRKGRHDASIGHLNPNFSHSNSEFSSVRSTRHWMLQSRSQKYAQSPCRPSIISCSIKYWSRDHSRLVHDSIMPCRGRPCSSGIRLL